MIVAIEEYLLQYKEENTVSVDIVDNVVAWELDQLSNTDVLFVLYSKLLKRAKEIIEDHNKRMAKVSDGSFVCNEPRRHEVFYMDDDEDYM